MCDMTICEIMINLVIGVISGIIAGILVNIFWNKKINEIQLAEQDAEKERQYKTDFANDIQILCRYLDKLQLELKFEESPIKDENIQRVIESHPRTKLFSKGMTEEGIKIIYAIRDIEDEIKSNAIAHTLTSSKSKECYYKLFKLECDLLKNQHSIRKSWEEYKNSNE